MATTPSLQAPRGTYDALPAQAARLRHIESVAMRVLGRYGYGEIRTPMFEFTDVFARNLGETTDVVSKEMYTFPDRNGESLTLRPEGTAPVVRAYFEHGLKQQLPLKLAYIGPMFRYERPQKGRYRQFNQIGVECLGYAGAWADVETIAAGVAMVKELGIASDVTVRLNSLGTSEDRKRHRALLLAHLEPHVARLSEESRIRLEKNPLRILDSKEPEDLALVASAPKTIDCLGDEGKAHFRQVQDGLTALGIAFEIVPTLVRGFDYYTHTVFEIHGAGLGAQSQVIGGGRYDGLFAQMGGESVPAVGWGCGLERLEMLLPELPAASAHVAVIVADEAGRTLALQAAEALRAAGEPVLMALDPLSLKAQFKRANAAGCRWGVLVGEAEAASGQVTLKDMASGEQRSVALGELAAAVR